MLSIKTGEEVPLGTPDPGSILRGISIGLFVDLGALLISVLLTLLVVGAIVIMGFGVLQFAWLVPISESYKKHRETETAKGILIAGGIAFLLSAACWGALNNL